MALFELLQKKGPARPHGISVPVGFEALADALRYQGAVIAATQEIGRHAAANGATLDDVLMDVALTYRAMPGPDEPPFEVVRALATSWADASLRYLHAVSCEDPLTGLSSLAHLRSKLTEIYRESDRSGSDVVPSHALVVVELDPEWRPESHFDKVLRLVDVAECIRRVYTGGESIGRLAPSRAVAVVRRDERLGASVTTLRALLEEWTEESGLNTRVWIEGLPASRESSDTLLDELAR